MSVVIFTSIWNWSKEIQALFWVRQTLVLRWKRYWLRWERNKKSRCIAHDIEIELRNRRLWVTCVMDYTHMCYDRRTYFMLTYHIRQPVLTSLSWYTYQSEYKWNPVARLPGVQVRRAKKLRNLYLKKPKKKQQYFLARIVTSHENISDILWE